ncbi:chemotaxis protein CheD [Pseudomonas akapageensis]|uniref:chemotaxis protein CheD n=1 Tax=Pseudomonas akapageensis TaxID=2609961 RepID=UPI00140AA57E|nr:chemotaxis protein CheD [Pseudomonas akapageensis]
MSQKVFIRPGGWFFGTGQMQVETVLGSCVTITLWHPEERLGGLCHFMLPTRLRDAEQSLDGRYGEEAVLWLKQQARAYGLDIRDCQAKLFGGAQALVGTNGHHGVGLRNIRFAEDYLRAEGVAVVSCDLGGQGHRYLRFDLATGDVWVRHGAPLSLVARWREKAV